MLLRTKPPATFALFAVALFGFAAPSIAGPMTTAEREHLVAHLEMTQSWLTDEVSHLSAAN